MDVLLLVHHAISTMYSDARHFHYWLCKPKSDGNWWQSSDPRINLLKDWESSIASI